MKEANEMMGNTKTRWMFKIWLALYQLENFLWKRYSGSFMKLNGGKEFHEYHQNKPNTDDPPF
jgi:hypothetical protein